MLKLKIPGKPTTNEEAPARTFATPKQAPRQDFADRVGGATASGTRNPTLTEGEYKLQIIGTEMRQRSACFLAELFVITSSNSARPPGMQVSYVRGTSDDGAPGDIQRFLFSACGASSLEEFSEGGGDIVDLARKAQDPSQNPLAGFFIGCRVRPHTTKKGIVIDKQYFYPLSPEEQKELEEMIA